MGEKLEPVFLREYWCRWAGVYPRVTCPRRCEHRVRLPENNLLEYWASQERKRLHPRRMGEDNLFMRFLLEQKLGPKFLDEKVGHILNKIWRLAEDCPRIEQQFSDKDGGIDEKKVRRFITRVRASKGRAVRVLEHNAKSYKAKIEHEAYVSSRFFFGPVKTFEKLEQEMAGLIQQGRTADKDTLRYLQRKYAFRSCRPLSRDDVEYIWRSVEKDLRLKGDRADQ